MIKSEGPIELHYQFNNSTRKLWTTLVEVDQMKKWFFDNIPDFRAEIGFSTRFLVKSEHRTFTHLWKVIEVIPENKITYNWKYEEYPGDSNITFSLVEKGNGVVELRIWIGVIEDFPEHIPEFDRESCIGGWNYFIDDNLRKHINSEYE